MHITNEYIFYYSKIPKNFKSLNFYNFSIFHFVLKLLKYFDIDNNFQALYDIPPKQGLKITDLTKIEGKSSHDNKKYSIFLNFMD